jgi:hypothetical protein
MMRSGWERPQIGLVTEFRTLLNQFTGKSNPFAPRQNRASIQ